MIGFLEEIAPLHLQESYDNAGLLTGSPDWEITGIMVALDTTEAVVADAIKKNCNLVVAHHPIIFSGLKSLTGKHYVERSIIQAIKNDIAIYAIHTNLDNVLQNGVNERIAQRLDLEEIRILVPKSEDGNIGSGIIGSLKSPMKYPEFADYLKARMQVNTIRHTAFLDKEVQQIALCGGSGRFLLQHAIDQRADVFISADFKYHEFFEANEEITIMDIGHYESEQFTINLLYDLITRKFPNFAAHCTTVNTNPINYR
jgi:dinuclear metal center YbgI/SA1388 family protein